MRIRIFCPRLVGKITTIGSKSYAHRELIASFLSFSETKIFNVPLSEDVKATIDCLKTLGAKITIDGSTVIVNSTELHPSESALNCNESGSTLRFLVPLSLMVRERNRFEGSSRLMERGIEDYLPIFNEQGISYDKNDDTSFVVEGKLHADEFFIDGSKSSQYITGLLFVLPLLEKDSVIHILSAITSRNYIDITLSILKEHGIQYRWEGNEIHIPGNQRYQVKDSWVEGDYSNAAFLSAYRYFENDIQLLNLNPDSFQGDKIYEKQFDLLNQGYQTIDLENCIDLAPVLFVFAAMKHGGRFLHTGRLALKESSRAHALQEELKKIGILMEVNEDDVNIPKQKVVWNENVVFSSHNDHRIVMALSLLSANHEVTIEGYEAVKKSYPNFFDDLIKLGAEIHYENGK